jgi:hypothetical protein
MKLATLARRPLGSKNTGYVLRGARIGSASVESALQGAAQNCVKRKSDPLAFPATIEKNHRFVIIHMNEGRRSASTSLVHAFTSENVQDDNHSSILGSVGGA